MGGTSFPAVTLALTVAFGLGAGSHVAGQAVRGPDTVTVASGSLRLRGLLWRPRGAGPFAAVLFTHGGGSSPTSAEGRAEASVWTEQPAALGPVFARHGYVFLYLFRRGLVLSAGQGTFSGDTLAALLATRGDTARNRLQVELLETNELNDALAGLAYLRGRPDVDPGRVAVVGHSYGGSLAMLLAERDSTIRAVVNFAGAAASWSRSPELRARLIAAARRIRVPVFFIHARNDYSIEPGPAEAAEMERAGTPQRLKIYPPLGATPQEGHRFVHLAVPIWEKDVFDFLQEWTGPDRRRR